MARNETKKIVSGYESAKNSRTKTLSYVSGF